MPTYLSLANWSDQGIRKIKDAPKRIEAFEAAVKANGGSVKGIYMLLGQYDLALITEAPNDETVAKLALATCMLGNVRTVTMRAFPREETEKIIAGLP